MTRTRFPMTPVIATCAALAAGTGSAHAQTPEPAAAPAPAPVDVHDGFSMGFELHRFQDDFGFGIHASTPSFANDAVRFTLGGGVAFYPYGGSSSGQTWDPYGHSRLVVEGGRRFAHLPLRLYGFGGFYAAYLPSTLSSSVFAPGGIGGFGFEVYTPSGDARGPISYFIELGGVGTGAQANKLQGSPIISNGFDITVGMRFYP